MKVRLYTDREISKLKQNMFVRNIKYKREIEYDPIFKLWSVMMRLKFPELSAKEIFARGGFDIEVLNNKLPQRRIKEWLDNYNRFGVAYFLPEDAYYQTINSKPIKKNNIDNFKLKLLKTTLQNLKELRNENR